MGTVFTARRRPRDSREPWRQPALCTSRGTDSASSCSLGFVILPTAMAFSVRTFPLYLRLPAVRWPVARYGQVYLLALILIHLPVLAQLAGTSFASTLAHLSPIGKVLRGGILLLFIWKLDILLRWYPPWTVNRIGEPGPDTAPHASGPAGLRGVRPGSSVLSTQRSSSWPSPPWRNCWMARSLCFRLPSSLRSRCIAPHPSRGVHHPPSPRHGASNGARLPPQTRRGRSGPGGRHILSRDRGRGLPHCASAPGGDSGSRSLRVAALDDRIRPFRPARMGGGGGTGRQSLADVGAAPTSIPIRPDRPNRKRSRRQPEAFRS